MSDRTPSTDALETLGMIHFKPEHRDAIHLAVDPVEAYCDLDIGQKKSASLMALPIRHIC